MSGFLSIESVTQFLGFIAVAILLIVTAVLIVYRFLLKSKTTVFIVVLGDIGRSPRMNYHCLSLTKLGYNVCMIGYKGKFGSRWLCEKCNLNRDEYTF